MAVFYFDEDVPDDIALFLAGLGDTVNLTRAIGRKGTDDYQQVWFAAARGWIIVTRNGRDYERLHRTWHLWGVPRSHAGIILIPQMERELHDLAAAPVEFFGQLLLIGRTQPPVRIGRSLADGLIRLDRNDRWTFSPTER